MDKQTAQPGGSGHKTRILLVDDHPIVRRGLMQLIDQEPDLGVTVETESAEQALEAMETQQVDLAIVDISLLGMNGLQLTKKIKAKYPGLPVLVLSMHDELRYAENAFRAGARGYVTKREAAGTIINAIRLVLSGKKYISEIMAHKFSQSGIQPSVT